MINELYIIVFSFPVSFEQSFQRNFVPFPAPEKYSSTYHGPGYGDGAGIPSSRCFRDASLRKPLGDDCFATHNAFEDIEKEVIMGITLTANHSSYSFDMGCAAFFELRAAIAEAYDEWFGAHYRDLSKCFDQIDFEEHDRITEEILCRPQFRDEDTDILDFLYAPDCDGKIGYRTCRKISLLLQKAELEGKRHMEEPSVRYEYEELRRFFAECYSHRRNAYWY